MQRLTISLGAGDHVAIVGRSGAGESDCDLMTSDCVLMISDCDLMAADGFGWQVSRRSSLRSRACSLSAC